MFLSPVKDVYITMCHTIWATIQGGQVVLPEVASQSSNEVSVVAAV